MKLVVGLGNPGEKYKKTRHNVGFMVIDELLKYMNSTGELKEKHDSLMVKNSGGGVIFAKPQTFMNSSGVAVSKLMQGFSINSADLWIIHDDLDIPLGKYKIQEGVGPKVHAGVTSIEKVVGKDFVRVRIGVDNRTENVAGEEYVLQKFTSEEFQILGGVIEEVVERINREISI